MEMGAGGGIPPQQGGGQYGGQPGPGGSYPAQPSAPPTQQSYPQQQYQQGGQGGGGGGAADFAQNVQRAVRTPETKPFFLTSEFAVWLLTVIALLIAGAVTKNGDGRSDVFSATTVWTLVTIMSFAYIISRGISKAGQKYRDRGGNGAGGGNW